jgi:ubiquinone/menaquinone biosynthesis C-methylase UbiE
MTFTNSYEDEAMALAYSRLEFTGTYYLAYRDIPAIVREHAAGTRALDFGCGTGRSTRFIRNCGFETTGVDISEKMLSQARTIDPSGDYRLLNGSDFSVLGDTRFNLIFSGFTFDNIPTAAKSDILRGLQRLLAPGGRFVNLVSSPDIYLHEWASFSTKDFPENAAAKPGDIVRIINTDIEDRRPVEDIVWPDASYRQSYTDAGLEVVEVYHPLGRADEPFTWVNETTIAPWTVYVLARHSG